MFSRALILATVMFLIGCFAAAPADAQATNLEAGKSPSQIFGGTCTACHKSPRGLLKSVPAGSLPSFLRQHYTTSPEMAGVLSSFLISNGATDTRYGGGQAKPDKDAKSSDGRSEGKPGGPPQQLDRQGRPVRTSREPAKPEAEPQQAAKPDADGISPREEGGRKGRNTRRLARPAEEGAKPAEGEAAAREAGERGPDGRKLTARQRLGKRGKPVEEMPKGDKGDKGDAAKTDSGKEEPASAAATKEDKPAGETVKDESVKPSDDGKSATGKSDTAKVESPKETAPKEPAGQTPELRADPVPPVTPAPAAPPAATSEPATASSTPSAKPAAPAAPPAAQSATSEPAAAPAPPPAPAAPAGPPEPPISR